MTDRLRRWADGFPGACADCKAELDSTQPRYRNGPTIYCLKCGAKRIAAEYSTEKTPTKAPAAPVQASAPKTAPSAAPAPPTPPAPQKAAPASFQKGLSVSKVGRR